jgi:pantoate--beta-alanine ligase
MLLTLDKVHELQEVIGHERKSGKKTGFVPTMGALHAGHLSLITRSLAENDITVCSIFINPTQFNDREDFRLYPRTFEKDKQLLEQSGCHILFNPTVEEVYPEEKYRYIDFNPGTIAQVLEGRFRPGHFDGMAAVVKRLFEIVQPDNAYFGQKDYQQYLIVRKMTEYYDLPLHLVMCPIYREQNGLAMSSRNERLSPEERQKAGLIYRSLQEAASMLRSGHYTPAQVKDRGISLLSSEGNFQIDYFDICSANDLRPIELWKPGERLIICTAVIVGKVRLIDNILVD